MTEDNTTRGVTELGGVEFVKAHDVAEMTLNVWSLAEMASILREIDESMPHIYDIDGKDRANPDYRNSDEYFKRLRELYKYESNWISLGHIRLNTFGIDGKGLVLARKTDASWLPFQLNTQTQQYTERNTLNGPELQEIGALLIFPDENPDRVVLRIIRTEYNK